MSVAFWSVVVAPGKPQSVEIPDGYVLNIQNVALEKADKADAPAIVKCNTVSIEGEPIDALIATLRSKTNEQFGLSTSTCFEAV